MRRPGSGIWRSNLPSSGLPIFFAMAVVMSAFGLIMIVRGLIDRTPIIVVYGVEWIMMWVVFFLTMLWAEELDEKKRERDLF